MTKLKKLKNLEEFYEAVETNPKVIIYWYTKWCPDCFFSKTYIGKIEKDFKDYLFYSCDRDQFLDLAKHLEIYGIPSFLIFENGDEVGRLVNKLRKSYQEVKTFIESVVNK